MENQVTAVEVTDIDFNGDGWHIKVGQFYSSPYSESHIKIIRIELAEDKDPNNAKVYFQCVNPRNYEELVSEHIDFHRAWHINDGTWDLERDVELPSEEKTYRDLLHESGYPEHLLGRMSDEECEAECEAVGIV